MKKKQITRIAYEGEVFKIEFYVEDDGQSPSETFIENLSISEQAKFLALFKRMGDHGKIWNEQKFKHLTESDQIFEFKSSPSRVFCFFFTGKRIILTHGFVKKSQKTPKKEIERAEKYKKDFERRVK